jgi:hypothetical protein
MPSKTNKSTKALEEAVPASNINSTTLNPDEILGPSAPLPSQVGATNLAPLDFSRLFFNMPTGRQDGVFEPLLCGVGERLIAETLPPQSLKGAFLLYLAVNSARLGYPLSVLLMPDDALAAVTFLDRVCNLAPDGSFTEFRKVQPEHLFTGGGAHFHNKCIVSSDPDGLVKVMPDLELMLARGKTVRQEVLNKRYEIAIEEFRAEWPVSFVGLAPSKKGGDSWHPSIIRLPVDSSCNISVLHNGLGSSQGMEALSILRIKKTFARLRPRKVLIPFADKLGEVLIKSGGSHLDYKMEILKNVISLCAIINQPPPVTMEELGSYIYQTDVSSVRKWLIEAGGLNEGQGQNDGAGPITADKKDLYLACLLLDGVLSTEGVHMTERQHEEYEIVKNINLGQLSATFAKKTMEAEQLSGIAQSPSVWATIEKIFEAMNGGSRPIISMATLYKDLVALVDRGVLSRAKRPKSNQYGYYVMRLNMDKTLPMPQLSNIWGAASEETACKLINPITGQVVEI